MYNPFLDVPVVSSGSNSMSKVGRHAIPIDEISINNRSSDNIVNSVSNFL